ncbi:MAG: AAA family ATPase, partial [Acetobacteraceae bacterium]|nr:AAA family ATPase [Acetobacteraceae bacterium]
WLKQLGLPEYEAAFRANAIDLQVLPDLAETDLEKLGVLLGHRKRMLRAIAGLEGPGPAVPPLPAPDEPGLPAEGAQRRQLIVMFCDLVGSTPLSSRLDPEDLRDVIATYHKTVTAIVDSFDGFVARYIGDGVLVYFGYPRAHEEAAERALRAALAVIDAVARLETAGERVRVRVGIATGLVVVGSLVDGGGGSEHHVVGETPNLAARLQTVAEPNTVLIDAGTRQLVGELFEYRDLGRVELKGFAPPLQVWQVVRPGTIASRFEALRAASATTLVGRDDEIALLVHNWRRAKAGKGQVVLICGEPGIGKSRLTAALQSRLAEDAHTQFRLFCSPHHRDSTLYPFINKLERVIGLEAGDTPEVKLDKLEAALRRTDADSGEAIGLFAELLDLPDTGRHPRPTLDPQQRRQATLAAFVRQVEMLTSDQPMLGVFEDAQWSDATSLELLGILITRIERLPVLLVITFRPEFTPPWATLAHVSLLPLNRLSPSQTTALATHIAGDKALPPEIIERIVERTDGIPLFVEELTKTLVESGQLRKAEGAYVLDSPLPHLAIPTTLHASLLARLDRLNAAKRLAQVAAALGRVFSYDLLAAVANVPEPALTGALDQLVEAELLFRHGLPPRVGFTFKHALVRDAAYSTLLRRERQQLHARIAKVLAQEALDASETQPEILAHHYTEAGLVEPAVTHWRRAGERAMRRWANVEAVQHFTRAIELLPALPEGAERNRLEFGLNAGLGDAMGEIKGYNAPEVQEVYSRAQAVLDDGAALQHQLFVWNGRFNVAWVSAEHKGARRIAEQCLELASRLQQPKALALAHRIMGQTGWAEGRFAEARDHVEECLAISRSSQLAKDQSRAFVLDVLVPAWSYLSRLLWVLGYPRQAEAAGRKAVQMAREIGQPNRLAFALHSELQRRGLFEADNASSLPLADEIVAYCEQNGVALYPAWTRFYHGVAAARDADPRPGIAIMRQVREALQRDKVGLFAPLHFYHIAAAHGRCGECETALGVLDEGVRTVE